jgi:hydroxymethylbilane synthase
VLISNGPGLEGLPGEAHIGTSSLRRRAQLSAFRRDLRFSDLRGNLDTRLSKLDEGGYDAIVLACAGLERMGWAARITERIPLEICLPAAGQGALAVEARSDDEDVLGLLRPLEHAESRSAVEAERSMLRALGGGCQVPIGACGCIEGGVLKLSGVVAGIDGDRVVRGEVFGDPSRPDDLGRELADTLLAGGAEGILGE